MLDFFIFQRKLNEKHIVLDNRLHTKGTRHPGERIYNNKTTVTDNVSDAISRMNSAEYDISDMDESMVRIFVMID